MRQDIAPNRFFRVGLKILSFRNHKISKNEQRLEDFISYHEGKRGAGVGRHLVRDEDGHVVLLRDLLQARHHLGEVLLPVCQLAAARVVHSEERHDTVDHEQFEDAWLIVELQKVHTVD